MSQPGPQTTVEPDSIEFVLPDPDGTVSAVRLWQEAGLAGDTLQFHRDGALWRLQLPVPVLERLEYLDEIRWADGGFAMLPDPTNPLRVGGPFGDKSWLAMAGYRPPEWLTLPRTQGDLDSFTVHDTPVGDVDGLVWTPHGLHVTDRAGWLLVHDGPEMAEHARILDFVGAAVRAGELPPTRVALLAPGVRNARYSANPDYADALVLHVLAALREVAPSFPQVVLAGASLGALAALHAHWRHPGAFAGLFLQSGSFFTPATDPQESGFEFFTEITDFVAMVHASDCSPGAAAVAMTCGASEENIACNRAMSGQLARLGLGAPLSEHRDMHNWTCWRDTFHPSLTRLLRQVWHGHLAERVGR